MNKFMAKAGMLTDDDFFGSLASSCGGAPLSIIRQYIEQQQTPG